VLEVAPEPFGELHGSRIFRIHPDHVLGLTRRSPARKRGPSRWSYGRA
jgi:hypothetical protein